MMIQSSMSRLCTSTNTPLGDGTRKTYGRGASSVRCHATRKVIAPIISTEVDPNCSETDIGVVGLAVMGQNLALNIAEHGFNVSVFNRSSAKTDLTIKRAKNEKLDHRVSGYHDMSDFVSSLRTPRAVIMLVQAGQPVDSTIERLCEYMEPGDVIVDGGNEWYENTERRERMLKERGILYMGMGVSGGEEGARNGPSMMPGGSEEAYARIRDIVETVSAKVEDGPCVTHVGPGGAGNFVKMVHNGIEYGDMQLISEAYDLLKQVGGLTNKELAGVFAEWNDQELHSFLIEITSQILRKEDDLIPGGFQVDSILDKTGMKGTGKWTVQQAAELAIAAPTIASALDSRFLSGIKDERVRAARVFDKQSSVSSLLTDIEKQTFVSDVKSALYASKVCSYAQGLNIIRAKSHEKEWDISLGDLARIWRGGCIIRAQFLDRIQEAYDRDPALPSLLLDDVFAQELRERDSAWRRVVATAVSSGIAIPSMSASLSYFDTYRRANMPANLIQAQRDFFGSHTYERNDGREGAFHTIWSDQNSSDSITTSNYMK